MTAMDVTVHSTFLPDDDPDASLAFHRDSRASRSPVHPVSELATAEAVYAALLQDR